MKKTPSRAPVLPKALSAAAEKWLLRAVLLLAVAAPLIDTLFFFPLQQITLANTSGTGVFNQIVSYTAELFNLSSFFLLLALAVYAAIADSTRVLGRILALHGVASVFIVILLRLGVYYLLALLDSVFILPFELCNQTLGYMMADSAVFLSTGLGMLISQIFLFLVLLIPSLVALRIRQKALAKQVDLSPAALSAGYDDSPLPRALWVGLAAYAVIGLINQVYSTVDILLDVGAPASFQSLMTLVVPYFALAIYCLLCYLVTDYGTRYIARRCAQ